MNTNGIQFVLAVKYLLVANRGHISLSLCERSGQAKGWSSVKFVDLFPCIRIILPSSTPQAARAAKKARSSAG